MLRSGVQRAKEQRLVEYESVRGESSFGGRAFRRRLLVESNRAAGESGFQRGAAAEAEGGGAWRSRPRGAGQSIKSKRIGRR